MISLFRRNELLLLIRAIGCLEVELRRDGCRLPSALAEFRSTALAGVREGQDVSTWTPPEALAQSPGMGPLTLSYDRAADRLGVSRSTVQRLVRSGALPVVDVGGAPRLRVADLEEYVAHLAERQTNGRRVETR